MDIETARAWADTSRGHPPPGRAGAQGEVEIARARDLSRYPRPIGAAFAAGPLNRRSVVSGNIFNSNGTHVAVVNGGGVFYLHGQKNSEVKGSKPILTIWALCWDLAPSTG